MNDPLDRDAQLAAALGKLEVPEHGPGFEDRLRSQLLEQVTDKVTAPPTARSRRALRPWLAPAAALTVAAIVAIVTLGPQPFNSGTASASEVRTRVQQAWASTQSLSGVLTTSSAESGTREFSERSWRFTLTSRGDFRLTALDRPSDVAYSAEGGVERSLNVSESMADSQAQFASEHTGLAPGPPDRGPSTMILERHLGSTVRAISAGTGGQVSETTYDGRPAWRLETDIGVNQIVPEHSPDHLTATIDQQTGLPIHIVTTQDGRVVRESRIEDLEVDTPVARDAFELDLGSAEVYRQDHGFRRVSLDAAPGVVGYDPAVPHSVPEGFELQTVAVSEQPSPTGAEAANPAVGNVTSLSYRRGLDRFLVTTRPVGTQRSAWNDPLATAAGFVDGAQSVELNSGMLAGNQVELLIDPSTVPHLWGMTPDLVITVSGDLSQAELLQVAESLAPRPASPE